MAKLYFRYGAMNCGKTTSLLQVAHNYEEQGMKVLLLKPLIDTKGGDTVVSRLGVGRQVDYLVHSKDNIYQLIQHQDCDCILVDEVQFLTVQQVEELYDVATCFNKPVLCFGLRTDFRGKGFPASSRLLEIAHSITELKNICTCGRKATMNIREVNGKPTMIGHTVCIDNQKEIAYRSVCSTCFHAFFGPLSKHQEESI